MCDNWRGCAENWRKESLASNQVVGSSSLSGRANLSSTCATSGQVHSPMESQFLIKFKRPQAEIIG